MSNGNLNKLSEARDEVARTSDLVEFINRLKARARAFVGLYIVKESSKIVTKLSRTAEEPRRPSLSAGTLWQMSLSTK